LVVVPLKLLVGEVSYEFLNLPIEAILQIDIAFSLLEPSRLVHGVQLAPILAIKTLRDLINLINFNGALVIVGTPLATWRRHRNEDI